MKTRSRFCVAAAMLLAADLAAAQSAVVTFDDGAEGWDGNALVEAEGGHPGANAHFLLEATGIEYRTASNVDFLGDLTSSATVSIGVDAKADSIAIEGSEVARNLIVEFRSHELAQGDYPWASVWTTLAVLQAGPEWGTYSVAFAPGSPSLPEGWGGYGAEDPSSGAPVLPEGVGFADVMAHVDEVAFTTFEPGYIYAFAVFDVRIDNLRIERGGDSIFADGFDPEPAAAR